MNTSDIKKQWEIITRGSEEVIGEKELREKLLEGKKLNVKLGVDPTAPDLHLGHTVVIEKLRQFQELGHKIIFIIGDFTAMIGDPSGRTAERPILSTEEIEESIKGYEEQVFKILKKENLEIVRNSKWLSPLGAEGIIKLTTHYTVARMLERNDFEQRYKSGNPISITEFIYPLLQGYDSVEIKADIEIGGTDQKFNLLMGRELQRDYGQQQQAILTMPLLEGTDGVKKMSKSYGNHIGIDEPANEIFGKVMSISDEMMYRYYTLLTSADVKEVKNMHPMEAKKALALEITAKYHNNEAAAKAKEGFEKVFSGGEDPEDMKTYTLKGEERLVDVICESGILESRSEIKRHINQGAVTFNKEKISDKNYTFTPGAEGVLKVGKRGFLKIEQESK
ncbi:tyrosine--tRNA ligase [Elusimicrobiota bacterium]